ncbi:MAG: hypothetical protein ABW171_15575 [Steroidobacter sp.]
MKASIATFLLPTVLLLTLASPMLLADDRDISKVNGSIRVESGRQVGSIETVNGSISIENSVTAGDVETVSGSISVGRDSTVGSVESVNGSVTLDSGVKAGSIEVVNGDVKMHERAQANGNVTSVNGGIRLEQDAVVDGKVENVNGTIKLEHARIGDGIKTVNGDITIGAGSRVDGGILVEKPNFNIFSNKRVPKVVIEAGAEVNGTLRFEREVELHVSNQAKVGKIVGATPIKD